jgi:hypothetical protein
VVQKEETKQASIEMAKGTVKLATTNDGLTAVSVYDSKPVHMLVSWAQNASLQTMARKVWDYELQQQILLFHNRLEVIDVYNHKAKETDLSDQMRSVYRPDGHWNRARKGWWAIFIWLLGTAVTNAYAIYSAKCLIAEKTPKYNHRNFLARVAELLCHPELRPDNKRATAPTVSTPAAPTETAPVKAKKVPRCCSPHESRNLEVQVVIHSC